MELKISITKFPHQRVLICPHLILSDEICAVMVQHGYMDICLFPYSWKELIRYKHKHLLDPNFQFFVPNSLTAEMVFKHIDRMYIFLNANLKRRVKNQKKTLELLQRTKTRVITTHNQKNAN